MIEQTVAPQATAVDANGRLPGGTIRALGDAGILGLTVAGHCGGGGRACAEAVDVVRRLAGVCGSTAMVVLMHYAATAVIDHHGPRGGAPRPSAAARHLTTLAFSEAGSRSHFWAPLGDRDPDRRRRSASTPARAGSPRPARPTATCGRAGPLAARRADDAVAGAGRRRPACRRPGAFDGLGSARQRLDAGRRPRGSTVPDSAAMLGADGAGLDLALGEVLPWFLVLTRRSASA